MTNEIKPFPKGDIRRLLQLALSMSRSERATLTTLAAATGHHKQTIQDDVTKLRDQLGLVIDKDGVVYSLRSWGPVLNPEGVETFLSVRLQPDSLSARGITEGEKAILARLDRGPIDVVQGRTGWRPSSALPKPAKRHDFDFLLKSNLARIDPASGTLVKT